MINDGEGIMDEVETVFKANMAAKLTALNTEKGDSLLIAFDADSWLKYRLPGQGTMPPFPVSFLQYLTGTPTTQIKGGHSIGYNIAIDCIIQSSNTEDDDRKLLRYQRAVLGVLKENLSGCFTAIELVSTDMVQGEDVNQQQFLIGQVVFSVVIVF